jgi:hypothetical protein
MRPSNAPAYTELVAPISADGVVGEERVQDQL